MLMEELSDGARHLYLVRHGQTALNAEGRLRGLSNPPLDETGDAEARNLAGPQSVTISSGWGRRSTRRKSGGYC